MNLLMNLVKNMFFEMILEARGRMGTKGHGLP